MDKLAKYHEVWRPLATYASTGEEFRRLFFTCMNYCGTVGADSLAEADLDVGFVGRKRVTISIHKKSDAVSFCRDVQQGLTLEDGAKKYQRDFKRVLTWLTDRNSNDREAALSFLWAHGRDIVIDASAD